MLQNIKNRSQTGHFSQLRHKNAIFHHKSTKKGSDRNNRDSCRIKRRLIGRQPLFERSCGLSDDFKVMVRLQTLLDGDKGGAE